MQQANQHTGQKKLIRGSVSLIRPLNGMITFISIAAMVLIADVKADTLLPVFLAACVGFFISSFGNASNDLIDLPIDLVNRPDRPLASGLISANTATIIAAFCLLTGLGISVLIGPEEFMLASYLAALLAVYNLWLKRVPFIGNVIVSVLTAAAFLYGGLVAQDLESAYYPALFAFLINLIREILKDSVDIEGDRSQGITTLPQILSPTMLRAGISFLIFILLFSIMAAYVQGVYSLIYLVIVTLGVSVPFIVILVVLWKDFSERNISKICSVMKYQMVLGLIAIISGLM
jgi:geranylgeranylglycerol-phosphate geranylgeranyltransferase